MNRNHLSCFGTRTLSGRAASAGSARPCPEGEHAAYFGQSTSLHPTPWETDDRSGNVGSASLKRDYYSDTLWLLPSIFCGSIALWFHVVVFLINCTDILLVKTSSEASEDSKPQGKVLAPISNFFAEPGGMFYRIIVSYPFAFGAVVLCGLTMDDLLGKISTKSQHIRRMIFYWIWAFGVQGAYGNWVYRTTGEGGIPVSLAWTIAMISFITLAICLMYHLTFICFVRREMRVSYHREA